MERRIRLCTLIPDLLDEATSPEIQENVALDADDAASAIEQKNCRAEGTVITIALANRPPLDGWPGTA